MTIYNAIHDGDEYRITKFDRDGNVQSSYTCNHVDCTCPAGPRDTCRHRQMLPTFLAHNLVNSHLFLDWDNGRRIVDFQGRTAILPATIIDEVTPVDPKWFQPATVQSNEATPLGKIGSNWREVARAAVVPRTETIEPDVAPQALTDTYTSTPERDLAKQRLHVENYGTKPANGWRRW